MNKADFEGRKNFLYAVLIAAGAVFYAYYGLYKVLHSGFDIFGGDFGLGYIAAKNLASGVSMYFRPPDRDVYLYAPPITLLFLPFIKLPEITARLAWLGLSHLLTWFTLWKLFSFGRGSGRLLSAAAAAGAVLFCMPVYSMLMMGNVNILIFAGLALVYGGLLAGRERPLPALLAFFALAKIFPGVLAGIFARRRDKRGLLLFFLWLAGAAVFSLAAFGLKENLAFLTDLPGFTKYSGIRHSQSLTFLVRLFWPGIGMVPLAALNALFLALLAGIWWKVSSPPPGEERRPGLAAAGLFALMAIMMLCAPSAWIMYAAFYSIPFYFVLRSYLEGRREFRAAWLFWSVFLLLNLWEIIFYQLPVSSDGLTLRKLWLDRSLAPALYRGAFSVLFLTNLGLFVWLMMNYRAFAAAVERASSPAGGE